MLDERDRRALEGIEQGLVADDPAFVRRMRGHRPFPVLPALFVTVLPALPFVAMFLGPAAALVVADLAAAVAVAVLACRHLGGRVGGNP